MAWCTAFLNMHKPIIVKLYSIMKQGTEHEGVGVAPALIFQ